MQRNILKRFNIYIYEKLNHIGTEEIYINRIKAMTNPQLTFSMKKREKKIFSQQAKEKRYSLNIIPPLKHRQNN